jgi:transposase-like protein
MCNIVNAVRRQDRTAVTDDAQVIYQADSRAEAMTAFRSFKKTWQPLYPRMVQSLENDLAELLAFFRFPRHPWKKLRTTNLIERSFVEVRRRTRPMVCFVNVNSVDRIIFSIFNSCNREWQNQPHNFYTSSLTLPLVQRALLAAISICTLILIREVMVLWQSRK